MNNGLRGRRATYMKNLAAARLAGWEKASYFEEEETGSINPKRSETEVCLNAVNTCQYGLFDGRRDVPSPDDQDLAIDSARDPSKWASTSSSGPTRTSTRPHTTICDPKPDAPAASPSSASCSARRPFRIRHGLVNCLESVNRRVVRVAPRPANSVSVTCTKARQSGRTGARSAQSSLWQRPNRPVSASLGSPAVGAQGGGGAAGRGSAEPGLPASSALETAAQSGGPGVLLTLYQILKVPVLGSRRSGKTTLIERFVNFTEPDRVPLPTMRPTYYYPVVLFNDCLVNLRLIDCPPLLGHFPVSSLDEWTDYPGWSLRSAAAFILVFDIASDDSFHYLRQLREKIIAAGTDVPMVVVANKMDVLQEARRSAKPMTSAGGGGSGSGSGWNGATNQFLNSLAAYPSGLFGLLGGNSGCSGDAVSPGGSGQLLGGTHLPTTAGLARAAPVSLQVGASGSLVYMGTGSIAGGGGGGVGSLSAGTSVNASGGYSVGGGVGAGGSGGCHTRRDLAMLVKKQWKGSVLVECSALYNWHVLRVFKELMKLIDTKDSGHKPTAAKVMQDALRRNQCSLI
ncbi:unnamed protein product [Protopolystoma xenopodis]|uniref:Uncharacterized protein n=1 Tax=Protopolystoma xenopodis TaxID=117903 RepID=A0A448XJX1_9PLAT|nr:unnamed protein product [Protopolystoma xenopodis]